MIDGAMLKAEPTCLVFESHAKVNISLERCNRYRRFRVNASLSGNYDSMVSIYETGHKSLTRIVSEGDDYSTYELPRKVASEILDRFPEVMAAEVTVQEFTSTTSVSYVLKRLSPI